MDKIRLPKSPKPKPKPRLDNPPVARDDLAKAITNTVQIGEFVRAIRTGLAIGQAELAMRAGVGRQWLGELEQGKPSLEVQMVLRVLLTLGFELVLAPYAPPPPWMLRACAFAAAREKVRAEARRVARNTRRERARLRRLAENSRSMLVDVE